MTARKFLTLLLALALLLGALSGCAKQNRAAAAPIVFVHGYSGWGEYDEKYDRVPYWGQASVNVKNDLERQGYRVSMASVGPSSSAWDRACELYAQLTGTRTDYGAAHSAACGHERYGTDYTGRALIPDFTWDEKNPDEVSPSFRGLASFMAFYTGQTPGSFTAAGETVFVPSQTLDASWQPNDCMVNAVSAYCPYHLDAAGNRVYDAHRDVTGGEALRPGEWNIFPQYDWSHIDFIGGISGSVTADDVRAFYRALAARLTELG